MYKRFFFYVIAYLGIAIVFFLIGEICFRVFRGPPNPLAELTQKKADTLFKPNSNWNNVSSVKGEFDTTPHINSYGYRGADFSNPKEKGKFRIFTVGDSFTFGVGAEDDQTIAYLIEEELKDQEMNVEVVNAGIGHTSPITHYINLRDIHLKYEPDLVLLLVDLTDLRDDWYQERNAVYDGNGEITKFDPTIINGKKDWWITSTYHSSFCKYIHHKIVKQIKRIHLLGFKKYFEAMRDKKKKAKALIIKSDDVSDEVLIEYDRLLMARGKNRKGAIDKNFKRTAKYLTKIKSLLEEHDIPLVIVMYPHGIYVDENQWSEGRVAWGFEENKVYADYYAFDVVESFAKEHNIPFINTMEDFLKMRGKKYFFDYDGHLTPSGNEVIASGITSDKEFRKVLKDVVVELQK